jgi:hypothetical protein
MWDTEADTEAIGEGKHLRSASNSTMGVAEQELRQPDIITENLEMVHMSPEMLQEAARMLAEAFVDQADYVEVGSDCISMKNRVFPTKYAEKRCAQIFRNGGDRAWRMNGMEKIFMRQLRTYDGTGALHCYARS